METAARLLRPVDDVATALTNLHRLSVVRLECGGTVREVLLQENIPAGHKFAVRDLADRMRIRKYGEFIGRTTAQIPAGSWVHDHNLATSARHDREDDLDWCDRIGKANVLRVFGDTRCTVGESPVYDERRNAFYWIDVRETPAIHRIDLATGEQTTWKMAEDIGSIVLASNDRNEERLLAGLRSGFAFFDCATATMTPIFDPEPDIPGNRMNDGKCDPSGRFWCGSANPESGTADGSLYVLGHDLGCQTVLDDFMMPNGMTWSADGATMYLADSRRGFIYAYDFDDRHATLGERRIFADLGAMPGGPDGATLDVEGYLWSAQFDGACVIRYAPDGAIDRVVRMPVTKPASCAFGGPGYRELFVTTASRGLGAEELRAEPDAGRVFVLDVGVAGMAPVRFIPERKSGSESAFARRRIGGAA